jgi:hypothetical protein
LIPKFQGFSICPPNELALFNILSEKDICDLISIPLKSAFFE